MSKEGTTKPEGPMEYKAKLDDRILYLLRLKAMKMGIVRQNPNCTDHGSLYDYLMVDCDHENGTSYFEKLRKKLTDDDEKYLVSVTTLKRLYGRARSEKPVSIKTLNIIAEFITDSRYKWDELQERIDACQEELEEKCMYSGSRGVSAGRPRCNGVATVIYSSRLIRGDKVKVSFNNGHKLELFYEGENKFLVISTDSNVLKIGYMMVITNFYCYGRIDTGDVRDKDGNLKNAYKSDMIKKLYFEGNPDVEWQKTLNRLERSGL